MGAVTKNRRQKGHFLAALASFAILGATAACGADEAPVANVSTTSVAAPSSAASSAADPTSEPAESSAADESSTAESSPAESSAEETSRAESSAPASAPETSSSAPAGSSAAVETSAVAESSAAAEASTYKDGTYTATGNYSSPGGTEQIQVDLTLAADVVTAVTVTPQSGNPTGQQFESQFAGGIAAEVVGKDIDTLAVSKVAGSSLTGEGFNIAIESIKTDAQA